MVSAIYVDIEKEYFNYLVESVCDRKHSKVDYIPLLDKLNRIKFVAKLDRDENRIADGAAVREDFVKDEDLESNYLFELEDIDVSVLEVLVGIAKRMSFQVDSSLEKSHFEEHFWELLANLGVEKYTSSNYKSVNIEEKVRNWMERRFEKDGYGSIFPLQKPERDQRKEEIWVQMSDYIWENYFC